MNGFHISEKMEDTDRFGTYNQYIITVPDESQLVIDFYTEFRDLGDELDEKYKLKREYLDMSIEAFKGHVKTINNREKDLNSLKKNLDFMRMIGSIVINLPFGKKIPTVKSALKLVKKWLNEKEQEKANEYLEDMNKAAKDAMEEYHLIYEKYRDLRNYWGTMKNVTIR